MGVHLGIPGVLLAAGVLSGCAGVGVAETNDPYQKLSQAEYLYSEAGRASLARRLLDDAIVIFREKNDTAGLAETHRQYGFLARMGGGALDIIRIDPRSDAPPSAQDLELSDRHFARSVALFAEQNRPDMVSNLYMNLATNSYFRGDRQQTCAYLDRSLEANRRAEIEQPARPMSLPSGVRTFADLIGRMKSDAGCT